MEEATEDPTTKITERGSTDEGPYLVYENSDGKKWKISGPCAACGACEVYDPNGGSVQVHQITRKLLDGTLDTYSRTLVWNAAPGTPNACLEENFEQRLDIPMTPDAVNSIDVCTMRGEWIEPPIP